MFDRSLWEKMFDKMLPKIFFPAKKLAFDQMFAEDLVIWKSVKILPGGGEISSLADSRHQNRQLRPEY